MDLLIRLLFFFFSLFFYYSFNLKIFLNSCLYHIQPTWMLFTKLTYLKIQSFHLIFFYLLRTHYGHKEFFFYIHKLSLFFNSNRQSLLSFNNAAKNINFFVKEAYDISKVNLTLKKKSPEVLFLYTSQPISTTFTKSIKKSFYYQIINFFFANSFFDRKNLFSTTGFYKIFFFKSTRHSPFILNLNKMLARWIDFFNLILNLFFYQTHFLAFSSPFFKNETLSLNWNNSDYFFKKSWKYVYAYFIFKTNKISEKTNFFFKKLNKYSRSVSLITDINYHYQNVYYLKKNYFFTIGLIPLSLNPWLVHYPVFCSSYSYLNQIFFLQMVVFNQKKSIFFNFIFFKKLWNFLKYSACYW